jgi:uncharacterized protein with PIN domain
MNKANFRFYGELNELLPGGWRQVAIPFTLNGPVAVKHPIEALGVPHTEVALILANDTSVDFTYLVQPGDRIRVFPPGIIIDVNPRRPLRPPRPSPPAFLADGHLGRLATYLRLLGFDTRYHNDCDDAQLAQLAHDEGRVLLTRDRRLLMRKVVIHGCCLRSRDPQEQLAAVLQRFQLFGQLNPWQRCLRCNGRLRPVEKELILDRLEPKTKKYYSEFHMCQACHQIYWKGSHFEPLRKFVEEIRQRGQ